MLLDNVRHDFTWFSYGLQNPEKVLDIRRTSIVTQLFVIKTEQKDCLVCVCVCVVVVVVGRFYTVLYSALEQTHCALVAFDFQ